VPGNMKKKKVPKIQNLEFNKKKEKKKKKTLQKIAAQHKI
jgi:hypothetical protein